MKNNTQFKLAIKNILDGLIKNAKNIISQEKRGEIDKNQANDIILQIEGTYQVICEIYDIHSNFYDEMNLK